MHGRKDRGAGLATEGSLGKFLGLFCLMFALSFFGEAQAVNVKTEALSDASHFEFLGTNSWDYSLDLSEDHSKILIRLKSLSSQGEELLRLYRDERIKSVEVRRSPGDYPVLVELTLREPKSLEVFDYLTDEPKRLVVDVFPRQLPAEEVSESETKISRLPAGELPISIASLDGAKEEEEPVSEKVSDSPQAASSGLFDAADPNYERFKVSPEEINTAGMSSERGRLFLAFPVWDYPHDFLEKVLSEKPKYIVTEKEGKDNLEARFLLKLFEEDRLAGVIKGGEIFIRQHPRSRYRQIIEHVLADAYLSHWSASGNKATFERATDLYKDVSRKYPSSPLKERTNLVLGLAYLKRGDNVSALRHLQTFKELYPESEFLNEIELALAHSELQMNDFKKSDQRLESLLSAENVDPQIKAKASHYRGNLPFRAKEWSKAIDYYTQAKALYPDQLDELGYATFNKGEALFWDGRYRESLDSFRDFLVRFPGSSEAGYAISRIGEIFEIMGLPDDKILGAYAEGVFRYRSTEGGRVARVRYLSRNMKNMGEKDLKAALDEFEKIKSEMEHPQSVEFLEFIKADGYFYRGDYLASADTLIDYLSRNPTNPHVEKFRERIAESIVESVRGDVETQSPFSALRTLGRYASTWLVPSDRLDYMYLNGRAYELAGAPKQALERYMDVERGIASIPSDDQRNKKIMVEQLPSTDSLRLRMASSHCSADDFLECEALLKKIENMESLSDREYMEAGFLAARIFEKSGKKSEIAKTLRSIEGRLKGHEESHREVVLQLARAYASNELRVDATRHYENYLRIQSQDRVPPESQVFNAYGELADLYIAQNEKEKAKTALDQFVQKYGDDFDLSSERYKLGSLFFEAGQIKEAEEAWRPLIGLEDNFWAEMARGRMDEIRWESEFRDTMNRMPASTTRN